MKNVSIIGINGKIGEQIKKIIEKDINLNLLDFVKENYKKIDLVFLAIDSEAVIEYTNICENNNIKIVDLSRKYRNTLLENWTYGIPEDNNIIKTNNISNPGCSAYTTIISLLPLKKYFNEIYDFYIDVKFGKSALSNKSSLFNKENITLVKPLEHIHEEEILEYFENSIDITYATSIVDIPKGISLNIMFKNRLDINIYDEFIKYYKNNDNFIISNDKAIDINDVIDTNKIGIYIKEKNGKVLINTVIDNVYRAGAYTAYLNAKKLLK